MILIGIGANLPSPDHGPPRETCAAAVAELERCGVRVRRQSRWYESAPVRSDLDDETNPDPWFINGVVAVETGLRPGPLLALMHGIEADFGRVRGALGAPRVLDLDLLDYNGLIQDGALAGPDGSFAPQLPHPRLAERAFVLLPLAEIAPGWRHPALGHGAAQLAAHVPPGQVARPIG